jgi:hypothetical protein
LRIESETWHLQLQSQKTGVGMTTYQHTRPDFHKANDLPRMPPLTGLEIILKAVCYNDFAPLALGRARLKAKG